MKKKFQMIALAVGLALGASAAQADVCGSVSGNLVANCGFEIGDFTNWTLSGSDVTQGLEGNAFGVEYGADPINNQLPNSGDYQAYFSDIGTSTTLSQTLATTAGASYVITLFLSQVQLDPTTAPTTAYPNLFTGSFGTGSLTMKNIAGEPYTEVTFIGWAASNSTTLNLSFRDDTGEFLVDDVSVKLPEPATPAIVALGLVAAGWVRRRQQGRK